MKAQKVVNVEIFQSEDGNTVVAIVFGIAGEKIHHGFNGSGRWGHHRDRMFTQTHRIEMGWGEGYNLRNFNGWVVPAPVIHPTETIVDAVEAAMMAAAGWDQQEDDRTPIPSIGGGSRSRGRLAMAA